MKNLKLKSTIIILLSALTLNFSVPVNVKAQQQPTFNLMVKNLVLGDTLGGDDNVLFFDIYIQHTNPAASGPFELALNQYFFDFNPLIANGGELSYKIVPGSTQFSNLNAIPRNPRITLGNRLDFTSNRLLAGNGPVINPTFPGTRVVTMRLATNAFSFAFEPLDLVFRNTTGVPFSTKIFAYVGNVNTEITNNGTYIIDPVIAVPVSVTLAPEGFLNTSTNTLNMRDTVRVYLKNNFAPYSIVDSGETVIDSLTLTGFLIFNDAPSGTYYICVKHRNSIETWSKDGGESYEAGWPFNYNFTTTQSQAYGNNMVLKGTEYCIYSGDVIQDGYIDLSDISSVYNDASNFSVGYIVTDVNGDKITDLSDQVITYNNSTNFIHKITPSGAGPLSPNKSHDAKETQTPNEQWKKDKIYLDKNKK